jgi:hypothetical protein
MKDLLLKLESNFIDLGIKSQSTELEFPKTAGARYIFVGHEWKNQVTNFKFPSRKVISKSVCLITENPGSPWFTESTHLINVFKNFLFINKNAYDAFPVSKDRKFLFQLFNNTKNPDFPTYENWNQRNYKFIFTGGIDGHRKKMLASFALDFAANKSMIICPNTELSPQPNSQQKSFDDFARSLENSKCLVNIHRANTSSLEWQRVLLAIERGSVVVSEKSDDAENAYDLNLIKDVYSPQVLLDPLTTSLDLYDFAKRAYETSGELQDFNNVLKLKKFLKDSTSWTTMMVPLRVRRPKTNFHLLQKIIKSRVRSILQSYVYSEPEFNFFAWSVSKLARGQKHLILSNIDLTRRLEKQAKNPSPTDLVSLVETRNFDSNPVISILIPIFREGEVIERTLKSVQNLKIDVDVEVLLCSDSGDQETVDRAIAFLRGTELSYSLYRQAFNVGVGATRNNLLRFAKGKFALILDGDNSIYPTGLQTLYNELKDRSDYYFAYGILAVHENEMPADIMSYLPWDKKLFAKIGNFVDALSLVDIKKILSIGGYSESLSLYGWEDFDLWVRIAEKGGSGFFVGNFVATYFRRPGSMISITDIDHQDAYAVMKTHAPSVWKEV